MIARAEPLLVISAGALLAALAIAVGPLIAVGLLCGIAGVAIIFMWPIVGIAGMILTGTALQVLGSEHLTGLPMSLGKAVGIMALAAWIARVVLLHTRVGHSAQFLPLLGFIAAMAISLLGAPDRALALDGLFRYAQLLLLFFMVASLAGEDRRTLDLACVAVTVCMSASSLIGLAEFLLPSLSIESDDPRLIQGMIGAIIDHDSIEGVEIKRITGGLSDSNWFAYTVVSLLPLNLYLFHRFRGDASRALILAAGALQSVAIVLSLTRSALIAAGVGVAVLLVRRRLPLPPVLAAVAVVAVGFMAWDPPGVQRLFSAEYAREGSTPLRTVLIEGGVDLIGERPLLGYGYSEFGPAFMRWLDARRSSETIEGWAADVRQRVDAGDDALENVMPHNTIIQLWVEYGLLGFAPFMLFLWAMMRDIALGRRFGSASDALLADCLMAGLWTFGVCAMFGHLAFLKVVWILGGLAAALRRVALEDAPEPSAARTVVAK